MVIAILGVDGWAEDAISPPQVDPIKAIKDEIFEVFDGPAMVQGIFEAPFTYIYLGDPHIKGVVYAPSFAPRLGTRILIKNVGATVTFALPIPSSERYRRGTSAQTDIILNSYWRQNAIDLYYQRYRSFYVSSPGRELSVHKPARYPQLPDARLVSYGANWYYVFRPTTFSLKAAFDYTEFQRLSGGSWLINPFYNHLEISLGSRFISGIGDESIVGVPNLASGRFDSLGASMGYGYSYIASRFFASGVFALGPGLQSQHVQRSDGDDGHGWNIAWKINVNASMGWNSSGYVGGVKLLFDSLSSRVADREVAANLVLGQIFFGGRF